MLADIGDEQPSSNAVTFSAHMTNIIRSLNEGTTSLCSSTSWARARSREGAALAISILEQLRAQGRGFAHYAIAELKGLCHFHTPGVETGSCEFTWQRAPDLPADGRCAGAFQIAFAIS